MLNQSQMTQTLMKHLNQHIKLLSQRFKKIDIEDWIIKMIMEHSIC